MSYLDDHDELPLLTEVAGVSDTPILPLLTEIVPPEPTPLADSAQVIPARALNPEEMHQLLQQLEVHLETIFTSKLNSQLEQLQRLAVDLAISEFKAELPQLLRDALTKADVLR